ncbi:protein HESO1-like [Papaver somniferum]|uniref:protein HESO1-like n=1 Tax=Papaver somniferum TaxID=3469 RepID=UPI000E6F6808|nr:protein HESO1-like [Papaver somniferum]XP_026389089.1 protein HESO1-like [Papaver somniferum]
MRYNMSALQPLIRRGSAIVKDDTISNHVVAEATKIAATYQSHNIDNKVVVAPAQVPVTAAELKLSPSLSYTKGSETLLEPCLREILKVIKPLGGDVTARYTIINDLRTVVGSINSLKGATVEPFGSFVSNLYTRWGDLDISIEVPCDSLVSTTDKTNKQQFLREIRKVLGRRGLVRDLRPLLHARVPVLIFESNLHNISCDISISNLLCQMKSKLLFWITGIDERFRDMVLLIKEWAKSQRINDPKNGTLNSHSLCLLVIFHFQTCEPPILPPLREIYEGNIADNLTGARVIAERAIQDTCSANIERFKTNSFRNVNRSSLSELVVSFFRKYSNLNMLASEYAICTYTGRWEHRSNSTKWTNDYPLFIEDPFEHADNTARTVSMTELSRICEVFDESYQGLVSSNHDRTSLICSLVRHPISTKIISPHSNPELFTSGAATTYRPGLFSRAATRYRSLSDSVPPSRKQFNNMETESDEATIITIRRELAQLMLKANTRNKPRSVTR